MKYACFAILGWITSFAPTVALAAPTVEEQLLDDPAPDVPRGRVAPPEPEDSPSDGTPGKSDHPLVRVEQNMRAAAAQIAGRQAGEATQRKQQQIVDDLERLLAQAQQESPGKSSSSPSSKPSSPEGKNAKQQPTGGNPTTGDNAKATESSERQAKATTAAATAAAQLERALEAVWGRLPARLRPEVSQGATQRFLPKYEVEIENYFRRLAEQPDK